MTAQMPLAAGRNAEQRQSDLLALQQRFPAITLTELLLSTKPVNPQLRDDQAPALESVLSDLAFQLH